MQQSETYSLLNEAESQLDSKPKIGALTEEKDSVKKANQLASTTVVLDALSEAVLDIFSESYFPNNFTTQTDDRKRYNENTSKIFSYAIRVISKMYAANIIDENQMELLLERVCEKQIEERVTSKISQSLGRINFPKIMF